MKFKSEKINLVLSLSFCLLAMDIFAVEIPLEKAEKVTNIAYVNIHKVFEAYPETEKARIDLTRMIEEKKSEITGRKEEIAKLKGEIDFFRKQMTAVSPNAKKRQEETRATESSYLQTEPKTDQTGQTPVPPEGSTVLTPAPGSPLNFLFTPPPESTETIKEETPEKPKPLAVSTSAPKILPGIPSPEPQLKDKETLLSQKQADLEAFVGAAEQEIKDLEEGSTMTLLAQIYKTIEEIAKKQEYSVIIDKDNILYGDTAIDITDTVILKMQLKKSK